MKRIILITFMPIFFILSACGGSQDGQGRWSKPERVLEGCDGVMSNSKQCQDNPNNQQMMIQIERN